MSIKISTLLSKVQLIPNEQNRSIIMDFCSFMQAEGSSENHIINNLKVTLDFAKYLGHRSFYEINEREQILRYLNGKIKDAQIDPDKRWITTWNHYLNRTKLFIRWLHNYYYSQQRKDGFSAEERTNWTTPDFIKIKQKPSKRVSPYLESEIWERDELLTVVKYDPYIRNRAILTLLWDLDARPHEITLLKMKHIRLKEKYGEGEIPHEAKTGAGPVLLMCSFPYVRDWINEHPFRNEPNARLICNLNNGAPLNPKVLWNIMNQLKKRIKRTLENGEIESKTEEGKLRYLLGAKKWNPYCIRHSAITADSDYLPDYALKKKVRWSMNSRQGARYIKKRMGDELKQKILVKNGIWTINENKPRSTIADCPRCSLVNCIDNKYCSSCSYPLNPSAFKEIKAAEEQKLRTLQDKYESEISSMREEMENKFQQILAKIDVATLK
jgi:integrase/recombinase XerD